MCLMILRNSVRPIGLKQNEGGEEWLMKSEKSGDQLMVGMISGTVCMIAKSWGAHWGTLSELG